MLLRSLLAALLMFCWCVVSWAQLPKRLERCLPNPTLAQEIRDMQPPEPQAPQVYVRVLRVAFEPDSKIPQEIQNEIIKNEAGQTHEEDGDSDYLKDLATEMAEVSVRGSLQAHGYFKPSTSAKATVLKTKGPDIDVSVMVSAEPGDQYRLGKLQFVSSDPEKPQLSFSSESLREKIPLKQDNIFDVDALRQGLKNLTSLYGEDGYIDFTAEPQFDIDEATKIIDLTLRLDAQKQYRIGQIEFWGVKPEIESQLRQSYQQSGEVFDRSRVDKLFKENGKLLPSDADPYQDVTINRDEHARMLDLIFDLRKCPGTGI